MKTIKFHLIIILSILTINTAFAHSGKPSYHVIIDTDGAVDDMRAISMFLAGNDIRVLAIVGSQGTVAANTSACKVTDLLKTYHHQGISVGEGKTLNNKLPAWSSFAQKIVWGSDSSNSTSNFGNASTLLNQTVENYEYKVILIALGSLNTYALWLENNPQYINKIDRIVWYNSADLKSGFNYTVDAESYDKITKLNIPLHIVSNNRTDLICNADYLSYLKNTDSKYARQIYMVHQQPQVLANVNNNHLKLWDDLVPLYLTVPMIFTNESKGNITYASIEKSIPVQVIYESIAKLLASGDVTNNRVFSNFPTDPALYKPEIAKILPQTLEKYGAIEWKVMVMTNEVHGHTGIYSIIGAKMGIRACEYFNVGVNNLIATSYLGNLPPLSCFNDGIQISTGATIGQGLITVSDTVIPLPTVIFAFNKQRIKMTLKPEISVQMRKEIKIGVDKYGLTSDQYWLYIEELAIHYWAKYDRHEIFMIEKL